MYEWMGEDGNQDLGTQDYTDLGFWRPVAASTAVPSGLNFTNSDSMGIGAAIVLNDVTATSRRRSRTRRSPPAR